MKKLLLFFCTLIGIHYTNTMEKWDNAYNQTMSIKPGMSYEEQEQILSQAHNNLSQFNTQLRQNPVGVIANNQNKQRAEQWESKNNLPQNCDNNNDARSNEQNELNDHLVRDFISWAEDHTARQEKQRKDFDALAKKAIEDAKKMNPPLLNHKKALLLAGASCTALSGWVAYKNRERIAEYYNRIDPKKLAKTCLYIGCGSAVFIAGLYGYKKLTTLNWSSKNKLEEPEIVIIPTRATTSKREYQDHAQEMREKYNIPKRERNNHNSSRRNNNNYFQEAKEEIQADWEHLKKTTKDTIEEAPELLEEIGEDIKNSFKRGWRKFKKLVEKLIN
ncbi:MAG: hypothetical protein ACOYT8_00345 [Candidatus Dependentiae bacterium]